MILPDANLLVYTYDSKSIHHEKSLAWWERCLSGSVPIGLPCAVIFAFVRIMTNPRLFEEAMSTSQATRHVRLWLNEPVVQVIEPGPKHIENVFNLLNEVGTAGNLVTDAQLAALAIEYDAVIHTADADFIRFKGLRWFNPLIGAGEKPKP